MLVLATGLIAGCGSSDSDTGGDSDSGDSGSKSSEPLVVGLATAKSGTASSFDSAPEQGLKLRVDQINGEGGVGGREIQLVEADTKSDPGRASAAAAQLIERGAEVLVVTCDFDFGSPAAITANGQGVPAISLCASDPKFADLTTIGPASFTMGTGTDAKASLAAEWAYDTKGWRNAFIFQDDSIEYTKSLGAYFKARWQELGGKIVGEETFNGVQGAEVGSQVTTLRNLSPEPDLIYLPAFIPPAATVIKQIRNAGIEAPIMSAASLDNPLLAEVNPNTSNVFMTAYGCIAYCVGDKDAEVTRFDNEFKEKFGSAPVTAYTLNGYQLISLLAKAEEESPGATGDELVTALQNVKPGTGLMQGVAFTKTCHKPTQRAMAILELVDGKFVLRDVVQVKEIPDIGDNNPCIKVSE